MRQSTEAGRLWDKKYLPKAKTKAARYIAVTSYFPDFHVYALTVCQGKIRMTYVYRLIPIDLRLQPIAYGLTSQLLYRLQ
jgi:hypothetical protein